jgi:hypothetical protein
MLTERVTPTSGVAILRLGGRRRPPTGASMDPLSKLIAIVFVAFAVEASLGFGSALVAITLGSMLFPLEVLLPAFVPLSLAVAAYITVRYGDSVDRPMLFRRVAPAMVAGLPIGLFAFHALPASWSKRALAVFILVLVAVELAKMVRPSTAPRPLSRRRAFTLLLLGGLLHGAFSTGGPLAVYVAGRDLAHDKARFRSTLSALWLALNTLVLLTYAALGKIDAASLRMTLVLAAPLALGLVTGEIVHARLPARAFRPLVFSVLGVAGVVLAVRA